jgi:hypothetical protein
MKKMKQRMRKLLRRLILWACPEMTSVTAGLTSHTRVDGLVCAAKLIPGNDPPRAGGEEASRLVAVTSPSGAHAHHIGRAGIPGAHVWILLFLILSFAGIAKAQQGGQTSSTPPLTGSTAPAGNCGVGSLYVNTTTGDLYDCNGGAWLKVNVGGSGAFSGGLGTSFQDASEIAAPANPTAGNDRLYLSSSTHLLACLTSGGANCMPAGGAGTVTQVTSGNFSPLFNVSVATNTTTPAFSFAGISQTQNLFFASPNGSSGVGAFRAMAAADFPASANSCATHQFTISLASGFSVTCAQPVAADIGSIPGSSGQLLFNNAGAIGAEDPVVSANQPAATTQTITATGALASVTVTNVGKVLVTISGTYAGVAFNFEGSPDGTFTPAFPVTASQVDAIATGTASGALPSNQTRSWFVNVEGHTKFRLNATAYTSGTANVTVTPVYFQSSDASNVNIANSPTVTANAGTGQFNVTCTAANCPINNAQVSGTAISVNNGTTDAGTQRVTLSSDSTGQVKLATGANVIGALSANQSINVAQINGNTTSTAATGVQKVGIVGNAGASVDGATGAAPPANVIYVGGLGSGATGGDLIGLPVSDTYKVINISTATTTLLITGVSGRQVRIGAIHFIAAGADNVALIEGTGATCGTGTAGMAGGTTSGSGYNLVANQGYTFGSGVGTVIQTVTTGDSVCSVTSAAVQLSGGIEYTIY